LFWKSSEIFIPAPNPKILCTNKLSQKDISTQIEIDSILFGQTFARKRSNKKKPISLKNEIFSNQKSTYPHTSFILLDGGMLLAANSDKGLC